MKKVFLVDGCRSPIGRGHAEKGIFHTIRADELASQVLLKLVSRTNRNPQVVNDFYLGCVGHGQGAAMLLENG